MAEHQLLRRIGRTKAAHILNSPTISSHHAGTNLERSGSKSRVGKDSSVGVMRSTDWVMGGKSSFKYYKVLLMMVLGVVQEKKTGRKSSRSILYGKFYCIH
ncbi:hypothetical protein KSP39_PZI007173 [Platanthera zijinensis]|uniref:Uncharacterized protein n=1 Tax=Platanthera zijinensis TaxID=2320716 RepID=A0AAP0BQS8_9ASPA